MNLYEITSTDIKIRKMTLNPASVNEVNLNSDEENLAAILALMVLLILFFAYCCWDSSCLRKLSSRMSFCKQEVSQNVRNADTEQSANNPTIILLPHGRILVVDGTVFSRFEAQSSGIDLFELGHRVLRQERNRIARSASIIELDSETNVKDCRSRAESPLPPVYQSLFCDFQETTPPSYIEATKGLGFPESPLVRGKTEEENNLDSIV